MATTAVRWRFERGEAAAAEIEDVAREVVGELAEPASEPAARAGAGARPPPARAASVAPRPAGRDPDALRDARPEVAEGAQGAEPVLTTIVVGIAVSAGSKVAESLWRDVVWPRVRRRLGARALGPEKAADPAAGTPAEPRDQEG